jgi:hypothetical protein
MEVLGFKARKPNNNKDVVSPLGKDAARRARTLITQLLGKDAQFTPNRMLGHGMEATLKSSKDAAKHDIGTDANYATTRKSDKQGKGLPHSTARKLLVTTCW